MCELAVRLKCAIMVMYDSEELGSRCEKHRTHLTNGLHILLSVPHLTPNKCASEGGGSGGCGKSLKLRCYRLHAHTPMREPQQSFLSVLFTKQK